MTTNNDSVDSAAAEAWNNALRGVSSLNANPALEHEARILREAMKRVRSGEIESEESSIDREVAWARLLERARQEGLLKGERRWWFTGGKLAAIGAAVAASLAIGIPVYQIAGSGRNTPVTTATVRQLSSPEPVALGTHIATELRAAGATVDSSGPGPGVQLKVSIAGSDRATIDKVLSDNGLTLLSQDEHVFVVLIIPLDKPVGR